MEENKKKKKRRYNIDHKVDGGNNSSITSSNTRADDDDDDHGGNINMKCCKSCTAGIIADCVALCCCPCALINLLTLAFVKVPWMLGKRLVVKVNKKKKIRKCNDNNGIIQELGYNNHHNNQKEINDLIFVVAAEERSRSRSRSIGDHEIEFCNVEEIINGRDGTNARSEAERVCLEFYQLGHLGFGRLSFTGIQ